MKALALCLALLASAAPAWAESLRIAAEPAFPPFASLDAEGRLTGFDKALGDEICARAGMTCEWVLVEFDELLSGVAEGRFDLAMSGLGNSNARRALVDFTDIYLPSVNPAAFVGRIDAPPPEAARIGVQDGTVHEEHVVALGLRHVVFASVAQALDAAEAGEVDLVLGSSSYFQTVLPGAHPGLRLLGFADVGVEGTAIAIAKGRDDLRARLNTTIAELRADGTIEALMVTWFTPRSDL